MALTSNRQSGILDCIVLSLLVIIYSFQQFLLTWCLNSPAFLREHFTNITPSIQLYLESYFKAQTVFLSHQTMSVSHICTHICTVLHIAIYSLTCTVYTTIQVSNKATHTHMEVYMHTHACTHARTHACTHTHTHTHCMLTMQ